MPSKRILPPWMSLAAAGILVLAFVSLVSSMIETFPLIVFISCVIAFATGFNVSLPQGKEWWDFVWEFRWLVTFNFLLWGVLLVILFFSGQNLSGNSLWLLIIQLCISLTVGLKTMADERDQLDLIMNIHG